MNPEYTKEYREHVRQRCIATDDHIEEGLFPNISSISAAFMFNALPVPYKPDRPELVYFKNRRYPVGTSLGITMWNMTWETAQFRNEVREERMGLPKELKFLKDIERHVYLVPYSKTVRYHDYAPLYHLLPAGLLNRHGLPLIKRGLWPYRLSMGEESLLPGDFDARLSRAFSEFIWPLIDTRSPLYAFSERDPVKLLSHNLDHWLPYIYQVAEEIARRKPLTEPKESYWKVLKASKEEAEANGALVRPPLCGGDLWTGEDEALEAAKQMVALADGGGRLRSIIDAIESHRIEDDFSDKWSTQKIDFERKFHKSRVKVNFVELRDAAPIHGPWSELHENRLWSDLAAIVNPRDRRVIVLLREGITAVGEISEKLGYKNHSPVSKALSRIKAKVSEVLE